MFSVAAFFRWLQLKRYQFELTIPLYMLTTLEKFFIYSSIFLITAMVIIAVILYLPEHISIMASRAAFYWAGEESLNSRTKAIVASTTGLGNTVAGTLIASEL